MNVKEFYDYILKYMTAEEALMKLLALQCDQYDKMKLGQPINPEPGQTINPLMILACAAMDLGWDMVLEKKEPQIRGLVVGTREYIVDNLKVPEI